MNETLNKAARIISAIFYPMLMPTYALMYVFGTTYLSLKPTGLRVGILLVTLAITFALPVIGIFMLYKLGLIKNPALNERRERLAPYIITAICFLGETFYLHRLHAPAWLEMFVALGGITLVVAAVINLWWKISGHAMGMGALTSIVIYCVHSGLNLSPGIFWPVILILISGLVMTSRLILNHHTLMQVAAGYALSVIFMLIPMLYL